MGLNRHPVFNHIFVGDTLFKICHEGQNLDHCRRQSKLMESQEAGINKLVKAFEIRIPPPVTGIMACESEKSCNICHAANFR